MYKVLLVDDEEMVTEGLSRFVKWEEAGFAVSGTATSVARALTFLEREQVDLVITDIQMPVQSGLELIRILKSQYPSIKSIILSGHSDFSYAQQAVRLGALDYLTKPINFSAMGELLEQVRCTLDCWCREKHNTAQAQSLLTQTLILNFATGYPYDPRKAAVCLNADCTIQVARIMPHGDGPLPQDLAARLGQAFPESRAVNYGTGELLVVSERPFSIEALSSILKDSQGKVPLCAGVSEIQPGYSGLRQATLQAGKALRYQSARGCAGVILFSQVRKVFASSEEGQGRRIERLIEMLAIPSQRPLLTSAVTEEIFSIAGQPHLSLEGAQRFCIEFLIELDAPIQSFSLPDYPAHDALSGAIIEILGSKTAEELSDVVCQYLQQLLNRLAKLDDALYTGELIDKVTRYIQEHFAEELSLGVLAEVFFFSPVYLSRLFKKKTGTNFVEYLTHVRIKKAQEYLANPDFKIYHIAEMVGYENPRYFGRLFKNAIGCTPQEYRVTVMAERAAETGT